MSVQLRNSLTKTTNENFSHLKVNSVPAPTGLHLANPHEDNGKGGWIQNNLEMYRNLKGTVRNTRLQYKKKYLLDILYISQI